MIGVIGGNGVAATNRLCQMIEEKITRNGAFRDAHHPEMIIWQATQAPSRSMYLEGRGPSWIEDYIEIGLKLKECGCTKLCMCCNTAHYAIDVLTEQIGLPFISLLDHVASECEKKGVKRVGMMCSDGLRRVGLYEKRFKVIAPGIELVYPEDTYQVLVTKGICNSKNSVRFDEESLEHPARLFSKVCHHLETSMSVDCIVAGCTDIRNVFNYGGGGVSYVDSLEVLADVIINEY